MWFVLLIDSRADECVRCCFWSLSIAAFAAWQQMRPARITSAVSNSRRQVASARRFRRHRLHRWHSLRLADGNWWVALLLHVAQPTIYTSMIHCSSTVGPFLLTLMSLHYSVNALSSSSPSSSYSYIRRCQMQLIQQCTIKWIILK